MASNVNQKTKYSAAQQLMNFNDNTSLYKSPVEQQSGTENGTNTFKYEATKLLAKTYLLISATCTITHASSTPATPHEDGAWNFIKKISLISHKGFRPFDISGKMVKLLNYANLGHEEFTPSTSDGRKKVVQGVSSSSGGTANVVKLLVELPNCINDRDLAGLILLQNDKINLTLEVTLGNVNDLFPAAGGFTYALSAITLNVYTDLFDIPQNLDFYPIDLLRVVKLNHEFDQAVILGDNLIKLTTGNTFRKIFLQFFTSAGVRAADSTLSDFYLILAGSNYKYQISPYLLAMQNSQAGYELPYGTFIIDFCSGQGLRNLAGRRDLVNTDNLGEMNIRVASSAAGSVRVMTETLTTMQ